MPDVTIKLTGAAKLAKDVGIWHRRLERPFRRTDAASRIVSYVNNESLRQITHGQFGDYPRLSPAYARRKNRRTPGRPILVVSGKTVRSMTTSTNKFFFKEIRRRGRTLRVGSKYPIAAYHQTGNKKNNLPARPLFVAGRRQGERVAEIVSDALEKGLLKRGR